MREANLHAKNLATFLALIAILCFPGCGDDASTGGAYTNDEDDRDAARVRALQALPYAGFVDPDEDDEGDGVVLYEPERSQPGYNVYTIPDLGFAELIDEHGTAVHVWKVDETQTWANVTLLDDGDLLVVGADGRETTDSPLPDEARFLMRLSWDGEVRWKRSLTAHHDATPAPNGAIVTLTFERRTLPGMQPAVDLRDDNITLLTDDGGVRGSLSMLDAIRDNPGLFPLGRAPIVNMGGELYADMFHCNSVQWQPHSALRGLHAIYGPDAVLVCFRHQDRIAVFDWSKRDLLWAWGQDELSGPHDAQYLENGNILVFDNGIREQRSRVLEIDPLEERIVWRYEPAGALRFFTLTKGSCQRLPNGNTLIANSDSGEAFEVTPQGRRVWRFLCPHRDAAGRRATIVRMKRFDREMIEALIRRHGG